jgi:epoxyqueuosine reductase
MSAEFATWLRETARACGALDAGCLPAGSLDPGALHARWDQWLAVPGNRGALPYLERTAAARLDPFAARPWARGAVVVAFAGDWGAIAQRPDLPPPPPGRPAARVSLYACGRDYHATGQALLARLAAALAAENGAAGTAARFEVCVDTRPVPDVFLAVSAGLGALGRNGLLRTPQHGSRVFIGVLFTSLDLPTVRGGGEVQPACAECGACVHACPTGALRADGLVAVRRCRSWLSMECRGPLDAEGQRLLGDCLFGCDGCTAPCPPAVADSARVSVDPDWILRAPAAELARRIAGTALAYAGPTLLKRNAAAVLGQALPAAERQALAAWVLAHSRSPAVCGTVTAWRNAEDA